MVLKGYFYVGASVCRLCESNIFVVRTGFCMDASHIFPQSVLAIILLIGGGICVVVSRASPGFWVGPPLFSMAVTALSGVGSTPQFLE